MSFDVAMLLRRAQLRKQMACEAALARVGMTLPQWGMLYAVAIEPDSSTHALALFIGQSDQSKLAQLEAADLVGRTEPVLQRAHHPELAARVALELQHHVDQVLQ